MSSNDYYKILRIEPDADAETIKQEYRKLVQLYHPDKRINQKFAEHKIKQINEAYSVLSKPDKRAEYDATRPKTTNKKKETWKVSSNDNTDSEPPDMSEWFVGWFWGAVIGGGIVFLFMYSG